MFTPSLSTRRWTNHPHRVLKRFIETKVPPGTPNAVMAQRETEKKKKNTNKDHTQNCQCTQLLSAFHEKVPARNVIYVHAQDVAVSDELLLAILKTFIPQTLNKQQTIGFRVF
jgi:hypothetical protein